MALEIYQVPDGAEVKNTTCFLDGARLPVPVQLMQYDRGIPILAVQLYRNGQKYAIPEGADASIRMEKPDFNHSHVYNPALGCNAERDTVYIEITHQMTAAYGEAKAAVEITSAQGVMGVGYVVLAIKKNPVPEGAVISGDEFKSLESYVNDAQTAAGNAASSAESAASSSGAAGTQAEAAAQSAQTAGTEADRATQVLKDAVTVIPQSLAPEQMAQARKNIGAQESIGDWALIEESVTAEPAIFSRKFEGLKAIFIMMGNANEKITNGAANISYEGRGISVWGGTRDNYMFAKSVPNMGYYDVELGCGSNKYEYAVSTVGFRDAFKIESSRHITEFTTYGDVAAGTNVKIWGVRA